MEIKTEHKTEIIGGKEYPLTITRYRGRQEIQADGKRILVEELAVFESPLGTSRCYVPARETPPTEEERAANRARLQEVARQIIRSMPTAT